MIDADISRVKLEDGDILFARVNGIVGTKQMQSWRVELEKKVAALGVKAEIVAVNGDVTLEVVKRNDLADVLQRLDDIEKKLKG